MVIDVVIAGIRDKCGCRIKVKVWNWLKPLKLTSNSQCHKRRWQWLENKCQQVSTKKKAHQPTDQQDGNKFKGSCCYKPNQIGRLPQIGAWVQWRWSPLGIDTGAQHNTQNLDCYRLLKDTSEHDELLLKRQCEASCCSWKEREANAELEIVNIV